MMPPDWQEMAFCFEACVESVESAIAAQEATNSQEVWFSQPGGAGRLELCAALNLGGLTPSIGMVKAVRSAVSIPLFVLVRPRPADFLYTATEIELGQVLKEDIKALAGAGVDGVVLGALTPEGDVDIDLLCQVVSLCKKLKLEVSFHRAFDVCRNPFKALEALVSAGISRVLTSGQEATAAEGKDLICRLVEQAGDRITIMAGGGVTADNAADILWSTRVRELHASCRVARKSLMTFSNSKVKRLKPMEVLSSVFMCMLRSVRSMHILQRAYMGQRRGRCGLKE
eukprot:SM000192S04902  [mRNA]  locus=s192:74956:77350:- [translate_table: standard]